MKIFPGESFPPTGVPDLRTDERLGHENACQKDSTPAFHYYTHDSGGRNRSSASLLYRFQQLSIIPGTGGGIQVYDTQPIVRQVNLKNFAMSTFRFSLSFGNRHLALPQLLDSLLMLIVAGWGYSKSAIWQVSERPTSSNLWGLALKLVKMPIDLAHKENGPSNCRGYTDEQEVQRAQPA